MIARWQSRPWFLVLQELEGRGWHISLHWFHTCLDTPMEIFTTSWEQTWDCSVSTSF